MEVFKVFVDGEDGEYCQATFSKEGEAIRYIEENEENWDMPLFLRRQISY